MNKTIITKAALAAFTVAFLAAGIAPALAQSASLGASVTTITSGTVTIGKVTVKAQARMTNIITRATQEINRRISALGVLAGRINGMQKLSADEKASLSSTLAAQVTAMQDLQTKINTDSSNLSSLLADIKSITGNYRIFVLVLPQGEVAATTDRVLTVDGIMTDLSAKLQARITGNSTANMQQAQTLLNDLNVKVSDSGTQANAANTETATLQPDNGNQQVYDSNHQTLLDARAKLKTANADLKAAQKDAQQIIKLLGISATATGSVSASTTSQ